MDTAARPTYKFNGMVARTRNAKRSKRGKQAKEVPPFERVWQIVKRIPRGRVATYGQISQLIDRRLTPIGVGWAIRAAGDDAIPWHRVVNARGAVSTDGERPGLQRAMLEAEGVRFDTSGHVDLARIGWKPRAIAR